MREGKSINNAEIFATKKSVGRQIVDTTFEVSRNETLDLVSRASGDNNKKEFLPEIGTKWKAWIAGVLLASSLNAVSLEAGATGLNSDHQEKDETEQMDDYVERIVREAKEKLATHDLVLLKMSAGLLRELIKEPKYKKRIPATGNAFNPLPSDYKDYLEENPLAVDVIKKQETMEDMDQGALYDKANEMARKIIIDNLGTQALETEEIKNIIDDLSTAYSRRDARTIYSIYNNLFQKMIQDFSNYESDEEINFLSVTEEEGPAPRKIELPENYKFIDLIEAIKIYNKVMLDNVAETGVRCMRLLGDNSSELEIVKEITRYQEQKNKITDRYLRGLTAEQKLMVTMDNGFYTLLKNFNISSDTFQRYNNLARIFKYKKAKGHTQTFFEEIRPDLHAELFNKIGLALVMNDKDMLGDVISQAKSQKIKNESLDYDGIEFDDDLNSTEIEEGSHDETFRNLRNINSQKPGMNKKS